VADFSLGLKGAQWENVVFTRKCMLFLFDFFKKEIIIIYVKDGAGSDSSHVVAYSLS